MGNVKNLFEVGPHFQLLADAYNIPYQTMNAMLIRADK